MIEIRDISLRFPEKIIFEHFSRSLPEDGIVFIKGVSGRGKTTLMRILAGLIKPDAGRVLGLADRKIGIVFQEDRLLPWMTALENVEAADETGRARELLKALGLGEAEQLLPRELSGGMARRVALARAMAYSNDVLMLDEPFTGLDEEMKGRAADLIQKNARLILLVTHEEGDRRLFSADFTLEL